MLGCNLSASKINHSKQVHNVVPIVKVKRKQKDLITSNLELALTFLVQNGKEYSQEVGLSYDITIQHSKHGEVRLSYNILKLGDDMVPYLAVHMIDRTKQKPKIYSVWDGMKMVPKGATAVGAKAALDGKPDFFLSDGDCQLTMYLNAMDPIVPKHFGVFFQDVVQEVAKMHTTEAFPLRYFAKEIDIARVK
jgi:hypothetical protein